MQTIIQRQKLLILRVASIKILLVIILGCFLGRWFEFPLLLLDVVISIEVWRVVRRLTLRHVLRQVHLLEVSWVSCHVHLLVHCRVVVQLYALGRPVTRLVEVTWNQNHLRTLFLSLANLQTLEGSEGLKCKLVSLWCRNGVHELRNRTRSRWLAPIQIFILFIIVHLGRLIRGLLRISFEVDLLQQAFLLFLYWLCFFFFLNVGTFLFQNVDWPDLFS